MEQLDRANDITDAVLRGLKQITDDTINMAEDIKHKKDHEDKLQLVQQILDGLIVIGRDTNKMAGEIKDIRHH